MAGTSARKVSVRTPDPGPSTAMDHLETALACHEGKVGKRSLEAASTVGSWLGMLGVTAGAGASEVLLRTYKRKHDRVGVQSTEEGLRLQGVSIQIAECEEHLRPFWPSIWPETPTTGALPLDQDADGLRPGGSRMAGVGPRLF